MILVLVEHDGDQPDRLSLEALTFGRRLATSLGTPLEAVLFGAPGAAGIDRLGAFGVSTAHVVEDARLDAYAPDAWAASIVQLSAQRASTVVVAAGSDRGNEVLARAATRAGEAMAANCTEARPGQPFEVTRQRWGGSLLEEAELVGAVRYLTVAPHALVPEEVEAAGSGTWPTSPTVVPFVPVLSDDDLQVRVVGRVAPETGRVSLADARVVVGGGRGVGSAEAFAMLEELAGLLGGAVGVSRVVTGLGWRPHAEQIGQTGQRIAPELYIACGVSGAIQHMVGAKSAKRILAINTDPDAPMVSKATYAVIGDLHAIVPAVSAEIRRVSGR